MSNWNEMDYEDRCHAVWLGTHDGELVKQIANGLNTTPHDIVSFARAVGIPVRERTPGLGPDGVKDRRKRPRPIEGLSTLISNAHRRA